MVRIIDVQEPLTLGDYAAYNHLMYAVEHLQQEALQTVGQLRGRTVWMVNSTEQGGGVAEMLPKLVSLLRELGVKTEWVVIGGGDERFFSRTKHIHNLLHGVGTPALGPDDRAHYEQVSRLHADALKGKLAPEDILVIHDPQPLGMGALLKQELGLPAVWRCHIGIDEASPATRAAWEFLKPWTLPYDRTVFTVQAYVPPFLQDGAAIIPPAIDPLSYKNRELSPQELTGILTNASLASSPHPSLTPPYPTPALRLQADGSFAPATEPTDLGLLFRPVVTQISRWDRLKGFAPLLRGFARFKTQHDGQNGRLPEAHRRIADIARLALAGPDPDSIQDDPEGLEAFEEVRRLWMELPPELQQDVAVIVLPMASRETNALMVNALQRCATVIAQNSIREGFGLTVTEGMWKGCPILGTHAVGPREQVRDGKEGRLVRDPEDPSEVAEVLAEMLFSPDEREAWSRSARRRVNNEYLIFAQAQRWLALLSEL